MSRVFLSKGYGYGAGSRYVVVPANMAATDAAPAHACPHCPSRFVFKSKLACHMTKHTALKAFECPDCGAKFSQRSSMNKHREIHTGVRYVRVRPVCRCAECGGTFDTPSILARHMLIHSGVKPFKCLNCDAAFCTRSNLRDHERTHAQERQFQCPKCEKRFKQRTGMNVHMRTHDPLPRFVCDQCAVVYSSYSGLAEHKMRTHVSQTDPAVVAHHSRQQQRRRAWQNVRYNTNERYATISRCRTRIRNFLRSRNVRKNSSSHTLLGASYDTIHAHLNSNSRGYVSGTCGVEVDHIRPLHSFADMNCVLQQRAAFHYLNLQLLSRGENSRKAAHYDAGEYAASASGVAIAALVVQWTRERVCACELCSSASVQRAGSVCA